MKRENQYDKLAEKFLKASHLYYDRSFSPISDMEFTLLGKELSVNFDKISPKYQFLLGDKETIAHTGCFSKINMEIVELSEIWLYNLEESGHFSQEICVSDYKFKGEFYSEEYGFFYNFVSG